MLIAIGESKTCTQWKNKEISWEGFVKELSVHIRTNETVKEYEAMSKEEKDRVKDTKGFVGGYIIGGNRKKSNIKIEA